MKNLLTLLFIYFIALSALAQAPQKFSYQTVIRNASNQLLVGQTVGIKISILQGSANGSAVYAETHSPQTNANGLATLEIGGGSLLSGNFANINWANGPFFVKTETDPNGGNNYTITNTSQLLSVPYALYAANAGNSSPGPQGPSGPQGPAGPEGPAGTGSFTHYIGEEFGGGVIFHLWKDAQGMEHGLIVDKTNLSTAQAWSNVTNILIGPSAQSTWDGLSNSNAIVGQAGHTNSAAALCLNSNNGGQSDWYLPSIDELSLLWHSRFNVNKTLSTIGGASSLPISAYYWSSTEYDSNDTWFFYFDLGDADNYLKTNPSHVRAVRAFYDNGSQIGSSFHNCGATNVHNPDKTYGTMTDQQGNVYKTIVIGTQEWMAENLKTSIYRNGQSITTNLTDAEWVNTINTQIGAWAFYNNDSQYDCPYGKLYNWYAVGDPRHVCPTGWHEPTDGEWTTLVNYLNGELVGGGKMKSTGLQYWISPNTDATNESGFSGLPSGYRFDSGLFSEIGNVGVWWSSSETDPSFAWYRALVFSNGSAYQNVNYKHYGHSVRCIRD